jgi:hypothetical protein
VSLDPLPIHEWIVEMCEMKGLIRGSHHGRLDLRLDGKIVVNLEHDGSITIKLALDEQQALLQEHSDYVTLPPGWGHHGWTTIRTDALDRDIVSELIESAIHAVGSAAKKRPKN